MLAASSSNKGKEGRKEKQGWVGVGGTEQHRRKKGTAGGAKGTGRGACRRSRRRGQRDNPK